MASLIPTTIAWEEVLPTVGHSSAARAADLGRGRFAVMLLVLAASILLAAFIVVANWPLAPRTSLLTVVHSWTGRDFVTFWSASALTLRGEAVAAYDIARLHAAEVAVVGSEVKMPYWVYPPPALLLATPVALLPYGVALALWLLLPLTGLTLLLRRLAPHPLTPWLVPLFTGVSLCLGLGQNGVLLTLLLGGGLALLDRRALLAGVCFGLLACKPQLAVLVGPALLVGGHYRALAAMAATVLALAAASTLAFGLGIWSAFLHASSWMSAALASGELGYNLMATMFAAARLAGLSVLVATLLQGATTIAMLACVVLAWRRPLPLWWRGAILAAAIPLATPYACGYDLALLALPLAWLAGEQQRGGEPLTRFEFGVFMLVWLAPAAGWILAEATGLLLTPLAPLLLLVVLWRRASVLAASPAPRPEFAAAL